MSGRHCILHGCALCFCRPTPPPATAEEIRRNGQALYEAMRKAGLESLRGGFQVSDTREAVDIDHVEAPSRDFPRPAR